MAKIITNEFKTWKELSNFIDNNFTHFTDFLFRGHAETEWKLESTLAREINELKARGVKEIQDLIDSHLESFKINIRGKSQINFKNVDENELWAMGQHFGLYTPLLDFTKSPYVALFFALQGESKSGKRCVWALSEDYIKNINSTQKNANLKLDIIKPLTNDNQRLVSQQGLFLKIPLNCDLGKLIEDYNHEGDSAIFFKMVFTDNFTEEALSILQNMNINQLTLFPDLIGSALQTNFQLKIKPYAKKVRIKIWDDYYKKNSKK